MGARAPLASIIVIGGGHVAGLAAIALKRAVPSAAVSIVDAPVARHALADRAHTALPSLARLHDRIGIDEAGMLTRAAASHRLATRYRRWGKDDWLIAYGAATPTESFGRQWSGDSAATSSPFAASGVAGALACAGRFASPSDDRNSPLSDLDYALRFDPTAYLVRLQSLMRHLGISDAPAAHLGQADLVIDTRGTVTRENWIDWSRQLPGRRVAIDLEPPYVSTVDDVTAAAEGYMMRSPGRDATRLYRVSFRENDTAAENIEPGRLSDAWVARTIFIGDAASAFEPLGWCHLHLAVCQIELLLDYLPGRDIEPLERDEYNRRAGRLADRVRDFVALHHGGRGDLKRSPELALTIAEFLRRGRLPFFEEESVPRDLWMQLLNAVHPDHRPVPCVLAMSDDERLLAHKDRQRRLARAISLAEPYDTWLAREIKGDGR